MSRIGPVALFLAALVPLVGCNAGPLTADQVRYELDNPTAAVGDDTMALITDDVADASSTFAAEDMAGAVRSSQTARMTAPRAFDPLLDPAVLDQAISGAVGSTVLDIFCLSGLLVAASEFDECEQGMTCEVELTIDSCVLRVGEDGDENASGKIVFTLEESTTPEYDRGTLSIEWKAWQYTDGDHIAHLDGLISLEVTDYHDELREEVIYSVDLVAQELDPSAGRFEDDVLAEGHVKAAMRITTYEDDTVESVTLEVLAYVDEDNDGVDDATLVIEFDLTSTALDDQVTATDATLTVRGTNGSWTCTWEALEIDGEAATTTHSQGVCIDDATGETFSWEGRSSVQQG